MSEFKGTPWPWKTHEKANMAVLGSNGFLVANCGGHFDNRRDSGDLEREHQANVALIAAAPDLLESLSRAEAELSAIKTSIGFRGETLAVIEQARAAIAKALGQ